MRRFHEALDDCQLLNVGFQGNPFTFSNRRKSNLEMRARLDIVPVNSSWYGEF